ncbi:MAG: carbohydrate kinase [Oscillospiraceae bacterium]|nr:carbohydrate kinase [Oscillospiraceae bacterium]
MDVVTLGELMIDFTCVSTDSTGFPTMAAHPGGAVTNFIATLARFGCKTAILGKVGNDAFGKLMIRTVQDAGVATGGVLLDDNSFTTMAFVTLDSSGDRSFSFARKPGADTQLTTEEVDLSIINSAKVFHFGTLSLTHEPARTATQRAIAYAKEKGKLISYDPNLRLPLWDDKDFCRQQLLWGLSQADVVKISDNEVEFLFGLDPQAGAKHILESFGVKLVFVTCGADGCHFRNAIASGNVAAPKGITVADTTGAGDIFGGSAMYGILQSQKAPEELTAAELTKITTFACTAASISTMTQGALSSIPTLEEVKAFLK